MAIVHETLVCEGYWCMGQACFVLLFVVVVVLFGVFCCFFYLHNLFSFSTYSSLSFYDSFSEYNIYISLYINQQKIMTLIITFCVLIFISYLCIYSLFINLVFLFFLVIFFSVTKTYLLSPNCQRVFYMYHNADK